LVQGISALPTRGEFQTSAEKRAHREDQTLVGSELQSIKGSIREMMAVIEKVIASLDALRE
jgi:hypothetical protein